MWKRFLTFVTALSLLSTTNFAQKLDFHKTKILNCLSESPTHSRNNTNLFNTTSEQLSNTFQENNDHWFIEKEFNINSLKWYNNDEILDEKMDSIRRFTILILWWVITCSYGIFWPDVSEYKQIKNYLLKIFGIKTELIENLSEDISWLIKFYNQHEIEDLLIKFSKCFAYNYVSKINKYSTVWDDNNEVDYLSTWNVDNDINYLKTWKISTEAINSIFELSFEKIFKNFCNKEPDEASKSKRALREIFINCLENTEKKS